MNRTTGAVLDEGFSLIEVLVSVVLLGIGVIAVLGGLQGAITGSRVNRDLATANTVLMSAAEAVKDEARNHYIASSPAYDPLRGLAPEVVAAWTGKVRVTVLACTNCPPKLQRLKVEVATGPASGLWSTSQAVEIFKAGP